MVQFPAPLKSVITSLLGGPSKKEEVPGITTAIPSNVQVTLGHRSRRHPTLATVNFNQAFGQITGLGHRARGGAGRLHRRDADQPAAPA